MRIFFTTKELFIDLIKHGIGAAGTAKAGSGVPSAFIELKSATTKKHWGLLKMEEVAETFEFPLPYHEYNGRMGTVDQHAQLTASYTVQHTLFRSWGPIFFEIINTAVCNAWVVSKWLKNPRQHKEFQIAISETLRAEGWREVERQHFEQQESALKPTFWPLQPPPVARNCLGHVCNKSFKRSYCRTCLHDKVNIGRGGVLGEVDGNRRVSTVDGNKKVSKSRTTQTEWGCEACRIPLCPNDRCWSRYHERQGFKFAIPTVD